MTHTNSLFVGRPFQAADSLSSESPGRRPSVSPY
jgi:hypothetical protein